jgi:hypothetical protein
MAASRGSTELKLAVVVKTMQPGMSISYVAPQRALAPSGVLQLMSEGAAKPSALIDERGVMPAA